MDSGRWPNSALAGPPKGRISSTEDPSSGTIAFVTENPVTAQDPAAKRLAAEMFLKAAGPALVKRVAEILHRRRIPVMPVKGVLLQRLVYGERSFRPIADVDILVPEPQFGAARAALRDSGFTDERWELGGWQVTLRDPAGPPLGVDLHRRLTRTR